MMNFIEDDEYMDEISKCPKCGETLEIVIRGMPADLREEFEKGFKFYFAGCCISGLEKTDYICQNCAREFDKDMNEIDFHCFDYLNISDVFNKRPLDATQIDLVIFHLNQLFKHLNIRKEVYMKRYYYENLKYLGFDEDSEELTEYDKYKNCSDEELIIIDFDGDNEEITFDELIEKIKNL